MEEEKRRRQEEERRAAEAQRRREEEVPTDGERRGIGWMWCLCGTPRLRV